MRHTFFYAAVFTPTIGISASCAFSGINKSKQKFKTFLENKTQDDEFNLSLSKIWKEGLYTYLLGLAIEIGGITLTSFVMNIISHKQSNQKNAEVPFLLLLTAAPTLFGMHIAIEGAYDMFQASNILNTRNHASSF